MRINVIPLSERQKMAFALVTLTLAAAHLVNSGYRDWNSGGNTAYVLLMLGLFFSRERMGDERVRELKLKAIMVGFLVGYTATFATKLCFKYYATFPQAMSAYDFMFVTLVAASAMFHYWRWQDGCAEKTGT